MLPRCRLQLRAPVSPTRLGAVSLPSNGTSPPSAVPRSCSPTCGCRSRHCPVCRPLWRLRAKLSRKLTAPRARTRATKRGHVCIYRARGRRCVERKHTHHAVLPTTFQRATAPPAVCSMRRTCTARPYSAGCRDVNGLAGGSRKKTVSNDAPRADLFCAKAKELGSSPTYLGESQLEPPSYLDT